MMLEVYKAYVVLYRILYFTGSYHNRQQVLLFICKKPSPSHLQPLNRYINFYSIFGNLTFCFIFAL